VTFAPAPLASPIIAPNTVSAYRPSAYLTPSSYRFAPTAVGTQGIVPGSNDPQADSMASLGQLIARASKWIDDRCYHRGEGSFIAGPVTEQMTVTVKPDRSLVVLCNFKPIREIVGFALGPTMANLANIGQNAADNLVLGDTSITLPGLAALGPPLTSFGGWPTVNGQTIAVYTYVSGWPHALLGASATAGASSITVQPPFPGATQLWGAYAGTPLTIKDGANTETVVLETTPTGLTLALVSPLQYDHELPVATDGTLVTALPDTIEQACISVVNVLLKTQGMRAQVLPGSLGNSSTTQRQALARAGALADFDVACKFLKPYVTTYVH
jgi:hypothetical protein